MDTPVIVVGELMLETGVRLDGMPRAGATAIVDGVLLRVGGPAFNMALNLTRLGRRAQLTGPAGSAERDRLQQERTPLLDLSQVVWVDGHSDLLFSTRIPGGFFGIYQRAPVGDAEVARLRTLCDQAQIVVLTGSRHERIRDLYRELSESSGKGRFVFAPNYAIREFEEATLATLIEGASIVSLNEAEADFVAKKLGLSRFAEITNRTQATVIVTFAKGGARIHMAGRFGGASALHVESLSDSSEDLFGAGDAFLSGFLHAHLSGRSVQEASRYGAATAAAFVDLPGKWPAIDAQAVAAKLKAEREGK